MPNDEPTPAETSRLILRVEAGLHGDIKDLRDHITGLNYVDKDVWRAEKEAIIWRVSALEDRAKRAWYLAVSAFIAPIFVGLVLALLLRPGGPW